MRRVTTDVEIGLLLQEFVDEFGIGGEVVLDVVFLLGILAREGGEDFEFITQGGFEGLLRDSISMRSLRGNV